MWIIPYPTRMARVVPAPFRNRFLGILSALLLCVACQTKKHPPETDAVETTPEEEARASQSDPSEPLMSLPRQVGSGPGKQKGKRPSSDPRDFTVDFFGMTYKGNSRNLIDRFILQRGAFEKPVLFFLRDTMRSIKPDGGTFLDVGANTGQYSLFMSKYSKVVHAVEPFERVLRQFREMIEINGIKNIVVHPVGLGDKPGKVSFYEPPEHNLGTGSFVDGFKKYNKYMTELPIVTGDSLFAGKRPVRFDIMKIDVEGYEALALQGLKKTLRASRSIVTMELTVNPEISVAFGSEKQVREAFPANYEFYRFDGILNRHGIYRIVPFEGWDFNKTGQTEVLAVPREKMRYVRLTNEDEIRAAGQR